MKRIDLRWFFVHDDIRNKNHQERKKKMKRKKRKSMIEF